MVRKEVSSMKDTNDVRDLKKNDAVEDKTPEQADSPDPALMQEVASLLGETLPPERARQYSPLVLAWIGDSVYSDAVRKYLILKSPAKIDALNRASIKFVSAAGQAKSLHAFEDLLTEDELRVLKNGRNVKSHVPKNQTVGDYRLATGFEALFGYLSLTGQTERLKDLTIRAIAAVACEDEAAKQD